MVCDMYENRAWRVPGPRRYRWPEPRLDGRDLEVDCRQVSTSEKPGRATFSVQPWPLTGRSEELAAVRRGIVGVPFGVVLTGASGVGKTRVAREALADLEGDGFAVEWASASAEARTISFGAIAPWLEPMSSRALEHPLDAARVVRANLERRHQGLPVVLAVDDAHLLDPASALLLQHLLGSGSARLLLTVRAGEAMPDAIGKLWKDDMAVRVELQALSETDTDALLRSALDGDVESTTSYQYWSRSGGNPLWLRELVFDSLRTGRLRRASGGWFATDDRTGTTGTRLLELIGDRLASVGDRPRHYLELLALGEPLPLELSARIVSDDDLEALESAGLVTVDLGQRPTQVRFIHPLYSEIVRDQIPALRTRGLWRELVDAVHVAPLTQPVDVRRLALWRLEGRLPVPAGLLESAAELALQQFDLGLSERLARHAVEAGSGTAQVVLIEALAAQGRWAEVDEQSSLVDPAALDCAHRARLLLRQVWPMMLFDSIDEADALLVQVGEATDDPALARAAAALRAVVAFFGGKVGQAEQLATELLGHPELDKAARRWAGWAVVNGGPFSGNVEVVLALAEGEIDRMGVGTALALVPHELFLPYCYSLCRAGRLDQALSVTDAYYQSALAVRHPTVASIALWVKGEALLEVGHLVEARRALRESANGMIRDDPGPYRPAVLAELSRACASMGDLAGSRAALDDIDAIEHYPPLFKGLAARAQAWSLACSGELRQAIRHALATARMVGDLGQGGQESAQLHDVVRMGRPDQVADRLVALAATAQGPLVPAYADHARALVDDSAGGLEATALQFAGMGAQLLAAEVWVEASLAYKRNGDQRSCRRCTIRADELVAACGGARTPSLSLILAWSGLTPREIEIASLAAEGLAAREIAARCVLSVRTVDNHLHNVYGKLGIVGRDELGPALRRQHRD